MLYVQRRVEAAAAAVRQRETQAGESQGETQGESQGDIISSLVAIQQELGTREHPGRVRGLGFGARPSRVFGRSSRAAYEGGSSSQPSTSRYEEERAELERQRREMLEEIEREAALAGGGGGEGKKVGREGETRCRATSERERGG